MAARPVLPPAPSAAAGGAARAFASAAELRLLAVLVIATALGPLAMQIFLPALPAIQAHHAVSAATAQLAFSLSALSMAIATLAYGPISDRFGRRPTMIAGLLVFLAGSALCALATGMAGLVVGRVVQSAGGCVGMVLSRAVVRDVYDRERSATMIAYITMAMVTAPMIAPAIGGVLTDLFGWRSVFVGGGVVGLAVLGFVAYDLRETAPRVGVASGVTDMLRGFRTLLRSRAFVAFALQGGFSLAVFFGFLAAAPYLMVTVYGRPAGEYGLLFAVVTAAYMVGNFLAARLTPRVGLERMVLLGSTGSLLGTLLALALALAGVWTPLALFGPTSLGAFAQGLSVPNTQAALLSVRPDLAGSASGLGGFVQMAAAAAIAQAVGSVQNGTPYPMVIGMLLCATAALLAAVVGLRASPRGASTPR